MQKKYFMKKYDSFILKVYFTINIIIQVEVNKNAVHILTI